MGSMLELLPGQQYQVTTAFTDYDKQLHNVEERWIFIKTNFLPYEDGLTLHVLKDDLQMVYRFQWRAEEQASLIENFTDFVTKC